MCAGSLLVQRVSVLWWREALRGEHKANWSGGEGALWRAERMHGAIGRYVQLQEHAN